MAGLLPEWLESDGPWSLPVTDHPIVAAAMEYTLAHLSARRRAVGRAAGVSECGQRRTPSLDRDARIAKHAGATPGSTLEMRLVSLSEEWKSAFLDMARDWEAASEHRYAEGIRDFDAFSHKVAARRRKEGLPVGKVPMLAFWLEHGGAIIGCLRLRLELTPDLEQEGGHIGYDVRPSMRRRGHGTELLRLGLIEARSLGIERVLITCDDDNLGSIQVIERNGGVLAGRGVSKESGRTVRRYWIE